MNELFQKASCSQSEIFGHLPTSKMDFKTLILTFKWSVGVNSTVFPLKLGKFIDELIVKNIFGPIVPVPCSIKNCTHLLLQVLSWERKRKLVKILENCIFPSMYLYLCEGWERG